MSKKVFFTVFMLIISLCLLASLGVTSVTAEKKGKPVVIGAPVPRASAYGQNGERGMLLAAEEINAAGGVKVGKQMHPLQLEIIDTRDEEPSEKGRHSRRRSRHV
jgi:branched-chain amino acid transport system substrate-binding protein